MNVKPVSNMAVSRPSISFVISQDSLAWSRHIRDVPHILTECIYTEIQLIDDHTGDECHLGRKPMYRISLFVACQKTCLFLKHEVQVLPGG